MADEIQNAIAEEEAEKPYNASDPDAVNIARVKSGRRREKRLRVIEGMMDIPEGRLWLYDLLLTCHVFSTPYVRGDSDASHIQMGEQNIGLRVLSDISVAAPDKYMLMIKEGKSAFKV